MISGKEIATIAFTAITGFVVLAAALVFGAALGILVYWLLAHVLLEIAQLLGAVSFEPTALTTLPYGVGLWCVNVIVNVMRPTS